MFHKINNSEYWVEITGEEGPPLVLLHGFTGSTRTWDRVLRELSPMPFQVVTVDLPGHGRTRYGEKLLTMEKCCADLNMLFDILGLENVTLAGYSMGGRTALSHACLYPKDVDKLLLESSSPGLGTEHERQQRMESDERLARKIEKEGIRSFVNFWENVPLFESQRNLPGVIQQEVRTERMNQTPHGLALSLRGMGTGRQPSWRDHLQNLNCPVKLVAGEKDNKFICINEEMKNSLSNASLTVIPNTGHAVHVERPRVLAEIIMDFMLE
ncbi:2-succinyl-6-hydroxy-2,4-cyclohexadiene-1-carboxylate synthase [Thalassobacillus pellis]|uniref:2-succinyl-6-hydroxy-2, 4-cyclohexadiene-1-carboxylate synthase n=1 Tax=Thalassobacillus pellis TaxID=748008 RepID=UPI001960AFA7|nr:2-succinyl-6-hydroxy-2,4-cyclohexadiene-1-carboxylate synthase [Thalassobacillus pellis]MBM7554780.1 2-succinyl-6-hydroxy-2,4-cyclohexadiene-1-carboxylate synthase [Thalassobacillus pellis]